MPGPRNAKTRRKAEIKKEKRRASHKYAKEEADRSQSFEHLDSSSDDSIGPPTDTELFKTFLPEPILSSAAFAPEYVHINPEFDSPAVVKIHGLEPNSVVSAIPQPCIHDPGNGPRVRDLYAFMDSPFAAKPALENEECMEFHYQDVLDFLAEMLPHDLAVILWYNRTRAKARICPVCQRFYRLGDRLYCHPMEPHHTLKTGQLLEREQDQSGICSFVCFGVAGYNFPSAVSAWGLLDHELHDETRNALNSSGLGVDDKGLGMYLKLTRQDSDGFRDVFRLCREALEDMDLSDGAVPSNELAQLQ